MNKRFSVEEIYINIILIAIFSIVYFFSFLDYGIRIPILLISIGMVLLIPFFFRDSTVIKIIFFRLMWSFAICIALIEMRRCNEKDFHGTLYFIFILLLILFYKSKFSKFLDFSESIVYIMGGVFAAFTLFEVVFASLYKSTIAPLLRVNGTWNVLNDFQLGRYSGLTNQPSINAVYICFGLGACFISGLLTERITDRIKVLVLIIVEFACILLTAKRGPLIYACLSFLIVYYFNSGRGRRLTNAVKVILFLVTLIHIVYFAIPSANMFLTSFFEGSSKLGDISNGRYTLYDAAWQYFLENKWFGIGWTNFRYSYFRYIDVHNIYLQLLCETGLVGAIPFYFAFVYTYIYSVKKMNLLREIGGSSYRLILFSLYLQTFFLLHGITSNALYDYYISFFYFLGVIISENIQVETISTSES